MARPGLLLQDQTTLLSFSQVREDVTRKADLNLPDEVIGVSKIKVPDTREPALEIPGRGIFRMTNWAQKQLGIFLGVQWDKWFDSKKVDPKDIQQEIERRFRKSGESKKLRLVRFNGSDMDKKLSGQGFNGYIRAVLGPRYSSIDDIRIFDRMAKAYRGQMDAVKFMKKHLSRNGHWGNDHCTYYSMVGEPINIGPIDRNNANPKVRQIYDLAEREGKLPDADWVYQGLQLRNSEVGYTAVQINEMLFRLVCLNGAIVAVGSSKLFYRIHRTVADEDLDKELNEVFTKAPERWRLTERNLKLLAEMPLKDPLLELEKQLVRAKATMAFIEEAKKAFEVEPLDTMYGVVQAITRAAQNHEDMDERYDLEALGGQLIANAPKLKAAA